MPVQPITLIIADAHPITRYGLATTLEEAKEIEVKAITAGSEELMHLCNQHQPDVVISGTDIEGSNGLEVSRRLTEEFPLMHIIMMVNDNDGATIRAMKAAGLHAYFLKSAKEQEIIQTIQDAHEGKICHHRYNGCQVHEVKVPVIKLLTPRETELLHPICDGLSTKEIAARDNVSPRTIENQKASIMEKLNVNSTAGIILYAIRNNLYIANIIYWLILLCGADTPDLIIMDDGI
jgi:two-component system nitrate/nitrite response regulator NarL